ncbi:MAG: hypothetical protein ACP5GJ_03700 [Nanopusillaceae archaeon]|jgi:hypothetical protein
MKHRIFSVLPIFLLGTTLFYFSSCISLSNQSSTTQSSSTYSKASFYFDVYTGPGFSPYVYPNVPFQVPIIISTSNPNFQWTICLASLPNGFAISGNTCYSSSNIAYNNYNQTQIYLPYNGNITLTDPSLLSSNNINLNIYECYQYESSYYIQGCFENQQCSYTFQSFTQNDPIQINNINAIRTSNGYLLNIYVSINRGSSVFDITTNNIINKCNPNNINLLNYSLYYNLTLFINGNSYYYNGYLTFPSNSNNYEISIPINYQGTNEYIFGNLAFYYYIFEENTIATLNVQTS